MGRTHNICEKKVSFLDCLPFWYFPSLSKQPLSTLWSCFSYNPLHFEAKITVYGQKHVPGTRDSIVQVLQVQH